MASAEFLFDDFVSDRTTWIGYGCGTSSSYYGAAAGMSIQNLNLDGTLSSGVLSYITTSKDPMFAKVALGLNADLYRTLEIRYRLGVAPDGKSHTDLTVYWTNDKDNPPAYGAYGYFNFGSCPGGMPCCSQTYWGTLVADGEWHVLEVELDDPRWRGTVWSLRIELPHNSAPGIHVDVDYVRFR
jgi:hypothetical protein